MGNVIEFPGGPERIRRYVEDGLDRAFPGADPKLRECFSRRVSETLNRWPGIPTLSFSVSVSIPEKDLNCLLDALKSEYNDKVTKFAQELIKEICTLQARLCAYEHQRSR